MMASIGRGKGDPWMDKEKGIHGGVVKKKSMEEMGSSWIGAN
jgi:hypothetical protein